MFKLFLFFLFITSSALSLEIPRLSGPVIDSVGILEVRDLKEISAHLEKRKTQYQGQVWILESLEGQVIEDISIKAVEKWKLGDSQKDNGLLLIIALKDRKMRLEVGQGLEGDIPDLLASRLLNQILKPHFKNQEYGSGILNLWQAVDQILKLESTSNQKWAKNHSSSKIKFKFFDLIWLFIFILFVLGGGRRRLGGFPMGGGGSWGSGGGWSGGGGGFSGGGSSSDW